LWPLVASAIVTNCVDSSELFVVASAIVTNCVDSSELFVDIEDHPTPMISSDKKRNADGRTKGK